MALRQLQGATADEVSRQALIVAALEAYLPTITAETTRLQRELSRSAPALLKELLARLDAE